MSIITKPMLADPLENVSKLKFPILASPKIDGIRCLRLNNKILSRKFLDIPNNHIQTTMSSLSIEELDGELITLDADGKIHPFNTVQGNVMREEGISDFRYYVFDYVSTTLNEPYQDRIAKLKKLKLPSYCIKVLPELVKDEAELNTYEEKCLADGYEGIMVRSVNGPYKCGRSTEKQGYLLKVKRFKDSEAIVVGFEELMRNENEATKDELGHTKRSSAKEGLVPAGTLGKFLVQEIGNTPWKGKIFPIGSGENLTKELRQHIWDNREDYLNKIVTYKYQPHGVKILPRIPIWRGFRDVKDL
jgi:DNA ligase-1